MAIAPLLKQGLSPYRILQIHPELGISEKTLYNYIEDGVLLEVSGICSLDLRRQVSRRPRKKKGGTFKKRADHRFLLGRTYRDYRSYLDEHPGVSVTQMDTVYNDEFAGPFIQTFKFLDTGILFGILHKEKNALSMKQGGTSWRASSAPASSAGMSMSCGPTAARSSPMRKAWRLPRTWRAEPGSSAATP